jgi:transposase
VFLSTLRRGLANGFTRRERQVWRFCRLSYAINQWDALNRYVEDTRLPIDNGPVERAITSVAIGRKNYLLVGSQAGAERAAVIYTVLGSCKFLGLEPNAYLRDAFDKLANGWNSSQLEELLPKQWLASLES